MSMFWCSACDEMKDSDDGCDVSPANELQLICVECMDSRNAEDDDGQPDEAREWADFDAEC